LDSCFLVSGFLISDFLFFFPSIAANGAGGPFHDDDGDNEDKRQKRDKK
jgi:hypothetical protein